MNVENKNTVKDEDGSTIKKTSIKSEKHEEETHTDKDTKVDKTTKEKEQTMETKVIIHQVTKTVMDGEKAVLDKSQNLQEDTKNMNAEHKNKVKDEDGSTPITVEESFSKSQTHEGETHTNKDTKVDNTKKDKEQLVETKVTIQDHVTKTVVDGEKAVLDKRQNLQEDTKNTNEQHKNKVKDEYGSTPITVEESFSKSQTNEGETHTNKDTKVDNSTKDKEKTVETKVTIQDQDTKSVMDGKTVILFDQQQSDGPKCDGDQGLPGFYERVPRLPRPERPFPGYGKVHGAIKLFMSNDLRTDPAGEPFTYEPDRNDFVRRVFAICGLMTIVTTVVVYLFVTSQPIKSFCRTKFGFNVFILCSTADILLHYAYICASWSRKVPFNYILNSVATVFLSYMCGYIASRYAPFVVLSGAVTTLAVVLLCLGLAYTSIDFTKFLVIAVVGLGALTVASMFLAILSFGFGIKLPVIRVITSVLSALINSLMLIIELQMVLGGNSVELGEDDYCFGAYLIYNSIIDIFIAFVRIFGTMDDD